MEKNPAEMIFSRKYAVNFRKNLTFPLGEMVFTNDFVKKEKGDPYPKIFCNGEITEQIENGVYRVSSAVKSEFSRVVCDFFPYATYEISFETEKSEAGFLFCDRLRDGKPWVRIVADENGVICSGSDGECEKFPFPFQKEKVLVVTARGNIFDIYDKTESDYLYVGTFTATCFDAITFENEFSRFKAELYIAAKDGVSVFSVKSYLDCGIAQADIRPIRYEDGTPILENGRLFFTLSTRSEAGGYQGVVSVTPSGCDFKLEGALFFDCGDGSGKSNVASSILFDRNRNEYLIWVCAFSHGHILGHGTSVADLKHGVHIIDLTLMEKANETDNRESFLGFDGDEDPDFFFDKEKNEWTLAICRPVDDGQGFRYKYFKFTSDAPFVHYKFKERTFDGSDTGGSFVKIGETRFFICGSDGSKTSFYKCYRAEDFSKYDTLQFDYPDGGFRGWGTVVPFYSGNRLKCNLYTFDRMKGSDFTWSYGNLYCFEGK